MLKRLVSERTLLFASCATVLFATAMLASLTGYGTSVTGEGLRRTLAHPAFSQVGVRVTGEVADLSKTDQDLRSSMREAFGRVPIDVSANARGDSYVMPGQEKLDHPQLTTFATYAGIADHATLTSGAWPHEAQSSGPVEAVLPDPAATAMRLKAGDTVTLHSRIGGKTVPVRITGTFKIRDPADYFWADDRLATDGVEKLGYTTFGPLVVAENTFARRTAPASVAVTWQILPDTKTITSGELTGLATRLNAKADQLHRDRSYAVVTGLPDLLTQLNSTVQVARSTMLVPLLQLVVLAAYALLLVARLISDHRRMEIALLRARGATAAQVARLTLTEGLLLALPAAVLAPLLAPIPLRLVAQIPSIKAAGLKLDASPSLGLWLVSIGTALACSVALTLPTLRGVAKSYVASQAARGRGERRGPLQRAGADVALLVVAVVAMWQLAHYGGPAASNGPGGIDPLTVVGPTLALLAGGALVMRLIPVVSRTGEWLTAGGTGFAPAMATRQLSRRPLRYAGPALLLVMAISVGVLSLSAQATWRQSQIAQADFQAGADLRVTPGSLEPLGQGGRYAALPGVRAVSPVVRSSASVGGKDVTLLAGDSRTLAPMLGRSLPPNLLPADPVGTTLPGRPGQIAFQVRLTGGDGDPMVTQDSQFSVIIADGHGLAREMVLGAIPDDGSTVTRTLHVADLAGPDGALTYPISIRGFRYLYTDVPGTTPLALSVVSVKGDQGPALTPPSPDRWRANATAQYFELLPPKAHAAGSAFMSVTAPRQIAFPGLPLAPIGVTLTAMIGSGDLPLPAVLTSDLAHRAQVRVGDSMTIGVVAREQKVKVAAIVPALPATTAGQSAIMLDLGALNARTLDGGSVPQPPTEWWLSVPAGTGPALKALAAHPAWSAGTVDRASLRAELEKAPLGAALPGALILGFVAALAFAVIGFAVNAIVSARERRTEFVIMRALGASGRQLSGLLGIEQAILISFGLLGGIGLGVTMARLVIPHIVLTVRATAPYPPVELTVPWGWVAALVAGVTALLLGVLVVLGRGMRKGLDGGGPGSAARLGEDR